MVGAAMSLPHLLPGHLTVAVWSTEPSTFYLGIPPLLSDGSIWLGCPLAGLPDPTTPQWMSTHW